MTLREILNPWGALRDLKASYEALHREYSRLTDRDARGRFKK